MPYRIFTQNSRSQRFSMRARLTLWMMLIVTIVLWATSLIFWLYMRESVNDVYVRTQQQLSAQIAAQLEEMLPGITRETLIEFEDIALSSVKFESVILDVYTIDGRHALENSEAVIPAEMLPLSTAAASSEPTVIADDEVLSRLNEIEQLEDMHQVMLVPMLGQDGHTYFLLFASSNRFGNSQVQLVSDLLRTVALVSPLLGLISGWFISGIAVAPIYRAQELIQQLNPVDFNTERGELETINESDGSEVDELSLEVDAARERIQAAFEAQERFLANVSHEIKTPIAVMMIESQTLDLEGMPEEVVRFTHSVTDEMKRLGGLVESFLTLTRLQDGHDRSRGLRVSVNEFIMDSIEHCSTMAGQQRVRLRPQLLAEEHEFDTAVQGEPELLVTMLNNLIRNAIRFSGEDGVVSVTARYDEGKVYISVQDEGPGIPEDRVDHIFDRFSQSEKGRRRGRGHGLGLSIAKGIAELHRGTIVARNTEPGCEFCITLPTAAPESTPEQAQP